MKKHILFAGLFGLVGLSLLAVGWGFLSFEKEYYQPRENTSVEYNDARGYAAWLNNMRANQSTGKIDPQAVAKARQQLDLLKSKNKTSAKSFTWGEMGPDNIGGRTRAIMFDKDDSDIMYAGGVSGGLFRSPNGGRSWVKINDFQENLAIVSICQSADGTIYYGTGEGMYYFDSGEGTGGILGGGIFKSTNATGTSFQQISSTIPTGRGRDWASVGKLVADPMDANIIYAGTNNGLWKTTDAGSSFTQITLTVPNSNPSLPPINATDLTVTDMIMTASGTLWFSIGSFIFKSTDGNNFTEITSDNPGFTDIPRSGGRKRMAVSPEDENYVYFVYTTAGGGPFGGAAGGQFDKAYQSKDGGQTWREIGSRSSFLNPHNLQGDYNHSVAVSPIDKERIFVGGVTLWEWSEANGWLQAASLAGFPGSQLYVHADNHNIIFHPNDPQTVFVTNDGGIFKSDNNGFTWSWEVKNYITTQFYAIDVGLNGDVMGGTQDNGTIYINPAGIFPKNGFDTPGINYRGVTRDGDGGYAAISKLDPTIMFKEMQYAVMGRSIDGGESYNEVYNFDRMDPDGLSEASRATGFAEFIAPFLLWEKLDDPNSRDSVTFKADSAFVSLGFGNGDTTYSGILRRPQNSAIYVPEGLRIIAGAQVVTSDAQGNLSGDGSGTFDDSAGTFTVIFDDPVSLEIIAKCAVRYDANSVIEVNSETNDIPVSYTLPFSLNPNDSIRVQDPVQSMFFVGLRGRSAAPATTNEEGGIWMARDVLSNKTSTPTWYHIGEVGVGNGPQCMAVSDDGDMLYVGTSNGRVYRFSNLSAARDSASTEIDDAYNGGTLVTPNSSVIQRTLIGTFSGRAITSISIHPDNKDKVVITVGNYDFSDYVYYSSNGTQAIPSFSPVQGDLPEFPVYSSTFDFTDPNETRVLIGTDYGVFVTDDITNIPVSWEQSNDGMANVPVFYMLQQKTIRFDLKGPDDFEGGIYIGTHGRGIFQSNSSARYIGIEENDISDNQKAEDNDLLNIFPNPAEDNINISVALEGRYDVNLSVRDISGKVVKSVSYDNVTQDVTELPLDVSFLKSGAYIVTVQYGRTVKTGKLIKR